MLFSRIVTAMHQQIVNNYLGMWNGNYSLLPETLHPQVHLYQDRIPTDQGTILLPIQTSEDFRGFIQRAREGWNEYRFELLNYAADQHNIVLRWKLNAVMGPDFPPRIPTTKKDGDYITYNGTDFLQLDPCSWLVNQVDSAQDFLALFHSLGIPFLKVI
ncbi:hypothetical protein PT974_05323 [Cladobotryum mycophilum]|uniref:SnoaL-like domain-containing protein n=1 Tax=Cladobotryum mycophilum TaxID=491253 RepID=A0ABR0SIF9_9HYPO